MEGLSVLSAGRAQFAGEQAATVFQVLAAGGEVGEDGGVGVGGGSGLDAGDLGADGGGFLVPQAGQGSVYGVEFAARVGLRSPAGRRRRGRRRWPPGGGRRPGGR